MSSNTTQPNPENPEGTEGSERKYMDDVGKFLIKKSVLRIGERVAHVYYNPIKSVEQMEHQKKIQTCDIRHTTTIVGLKKCALQ